MPHPAPLTNAQANGAVASINSRPEILIYTIYIYMDSDRQHVETDVNILTSRKMTHNLLGNTHKKTQV